MVLVLKIRFTVVPKPHILLIFKQLPKLMNVIPIAKQYHICRIHWGPGYRIYFGLEGNNIMILLGGGTKKQQQRDISVAKELWEEYKERKKTK